MEEAPRSKKRHLLLAFAVLLLPLALAGCAESTSPQAWFGRPESDFARILQGLFDRIILIATIVFVVVEGILFIALFRFRRRPGQGLPSQTHGNTQLEIGWTIVPAVALAFVAVPTVRAIFETYHPDTTNTVKVQVIGHQWWWEFRYPDLGIVTANEPHFPVGQKATLTIESADVIHGFWIPGLGGKRDAIPTRVNELWWTPEKTGEYYGQCTQLCATSHANMRIRAFVDDQNGWNAWVNAMKSANGSQPAPDVQRGYQLFTTNACVGCHTIQGTPANGQVGPNLTRFGARTTFGAGLYQNTQENVTSWILDPQAAKPGNKMPNLHLSEEDASAIAAYLRSLK
ncbi:MAG TPA: cytochrome c oxidase subunit II [Chloroflexota bacterium]|jgi:cytochrome c oxidase subunit 2|nr:cytochrome c oxidase subunit II [Chloroflexota bacterium]